MGREGVYGGYNILGLYRVIWGLGFRALLQKSVAVVNCTISLAALIIRSSDCNHPVDAENLP